MKYALKSAPAVGMAPNNRKEDMYAVADLKRAQI